MSDAPANQPEGRDMSNVAKLNSNRDVNGITVESGIPMPKRVMGRPMKYPFRLMKVGDSFLLKGVSIGKAGSICAMARRRGDGSFSFRSVEGGYRIWRVA